MLCSAWPKWDSPGLNIAEIDEQGKEGNQCLSFMTLQMLLCLWQVFYGAPFTPQADLYIGYGNPLVYTSENKGPGQLNLAVGDKDSLKSPLDHLLPAHGLSSPF